jgi:hypothetical protein
MRAFPAAIGVVVVMALAGVASAGKPRVAMVAFEGDPGGQAQDVVSDAIGDDTQVLGTNEVTRAVDKIGLDVNALEDKDLRKLSKELEADAIIQGKLSMKGANHLLHFKLFVKGKKQKGFKIEFGSLKSKKFKEKLHDKMIERLGGEVKAKKGSAASEGNDDDTSAKKKKGGSEGDDDAAAKKKKGGASEGNDDALATMKKKKGGASEGNEGDDDGAAKKKAGGDDAGDDDKKKPDDDKGHKGKKRTAKAGGDDDAEIEGHVEVGAGATAHSANRVAFRLDVGGSGEQRKLSFVTRNNFPQAPKGYSNTIVPGFRVEGQLYPLAFGNPNSTGAGLGLGGMYDQTAVLNLTSSAQMGTKFPVTQRRFSVGPRFRVVFGAKPSSPSVTLGVGFGHRTFKVNRGALDPGNMIDLPDVDYVGFSPMLEFRLPFGDKVALTLSGGTAFLTSASSGIYGIQDPTQYGQARITEGEGTVGIEFMLTKLIALRVSGDFAQYGYKFTGNGKQTNSRDMDPGSPDIGGAADRYFGGALTLAVLY